MARLLAALLFCLALAPALSIAADPPGLDPDPIPALNPLCLTANSRIECRPPEPGPWRCTAAFPNSVIQSDDPPCSLADETVAPTARRCSYDEAWVYAETNRSYHPQCGYFQRAGLVVRNEHHSLGFLSSLEDRYGITNDCTAQPITSINAVATCVRSFNCPAGYTLSGVLGTCTRPRTCPQGSTLDPATGQCLIPPEKATDRCPSLNKPISIGYGDKHLLETDWHSPDPLATQLERRYNSLALDAATPLLGPGWRLPIERALEPGTDTLTARRPDGRLYRFTTDATGWHPADPDIDERIEVRPTGWRLTTPEHTLEDYDSTGRLTRLTQADGTLIDLIRATDGTLLALQDAVGRRWSLGYDTGRLASLTAPDGATVRYGYDAGQLTTVTYPDGTVRRYHYNEAAHTGGANLPRALTGLTDERGVRLLTWTYDATGRATSSELAGGLDRYRLAYTTTADGTHTDVTDPLGTVRGYDFTLRHGVLKPTAQTQPGGAGCGPAAETIDYDANGNPTRTRDFDGIEHTTTYDPARNLETRRTETSAGLTRTTTTAWHTRWRQPIERTEAGKRTTWRYHGDTINGVTVSCAPTLPEALPLLCQRTEQATQDADGTQGLAATDDATVTARTWRWTYDVKGRLTNNKTPVGLTEYSYAYYLDTNANPNLRGRLSILSDGLGMRTVINAYDGAGRILQSTDPNGLATTYQYDPRGRLTRSQSGTEQTTYTYDPAGRLTRLTRPDGSLLDYTYDDAGRLTAVTDADGNRSTYTLDAAGNRIGEHLTDAAGQSILQRRYTRDPLGRIATETDGEGASTDYQYRASGALTLTTAPLERNRHTGFDAFGRPSTDTDPLNQTITTTYDPADRIKTVTDPKGLVTTYTHDGLGNLTRLQSPDSGTHTYTFDAAGYLAKHTEYTTTGGVLRSARYTRDALFRVTRTILADDTHTYTYDNCPNGKGRLCAMQNGAGQIGWSYDAHGRITQRSTTLGAHTLTTGASFDAAGRLSTLTTPSGHTLTYTWDKDRLTGVNLDGSALITDITRAPFGALDAWRWADGTDTVRLFNRNGEPIAQAVQLPNEATHSTVLTRDAAGRITHIEETDTPNQTYTYDLADRLKQAEGHWGTLGWTYDGTGNRQSQTQTGLANTAYTYPTTSHRLQTKTGPDPKSYTYDPSGRLTSDGSLTYVYDGAGRLKEIRQGANVMRYGYSPDGRRLYKDNGTEQRLFVHDEQGLLLGEYRATATSWSLVAEYVWLGELPVATIKPDPANPNATQVYRIEPDHLGTPRRVADSQNNTVWRWSSAPFGDTVPNEDPSGSGQNFTLNLRFAGQYFDRESGMHYNFNRYYNSKDGRYISSDPIGLEGGINTYIYVGGNPINYIDPLGLMKLPNDPSGLSSDWQRDSSYRDPNGERYRHPSGDSVDFHRGRPDAPGWRGKDHWHHNGGEEHLKPGDEIPDPQPTPPADDSQNNQKNMCGKGCQQVWKAIRDTTGAIIFFAIAWVCA